MTASAKLTGNPLVEDTTNLLFFFFLPVEPLVSNLFFGVYQSSRMFFALHVLDYIWECVTVLESSSFNALT